ncbi:hypothetical protein COU56_02915 [Candidatus Pacearchaeota archaeon CG10_big_fil_rev_8_21_14_0_10_31_9]|nr:MAG: hypothetical protein COU56_02915 [Candidatus Pacearchaeota archaeon CG10_big_fil_rev_8_21_14_0_10_31_9]
MKSRENLVGAYAVLFGVIIAVIFGLFQRFILISWVGWIYGILAIIGILIGAISVSNDSKEATTFLLATVALVIVSSVGQERLILIGDVGLLIITILNALLTMFVPATIVVALKTVFSIASLK